MHDTDYFTAYRTIRAKDWAHERRHDLYLSL